MLVDGEAEVVAGSPTHHKDVILSGAPTDLSRNTALGAAESKDPEGLILPMPLGAFQPPKPAPGGPATVFPAGRDKNCWHLTNVPQLHSLQPYTHQARLAADPVLGLRWPKAPSGMGKISPSGSFDSAPPSVVSRDKSARRSAQDDDFVGVLTKNHPDKLALMGLRSGLHSLTFSRPRGADIRHG